MRQTILYKPYTLLYLQIRLLQEERLNPNVVMPMCNFGCDELFEKGIISVDIFGNFYQKKETNSDTIQKHIDSIIGKKCDYYSDDSEIFFKWHRELVH